MHISHKRIAATLSNLTFTLLVHDQTKNDIDAKYGAAADENYHKI